MRIKSSLEYEVEHMKTVIGTALCALVVAALATGAVYAAASCCPATGTCSTVVAAPDNTLTPAEKAAGWRLLFDGKTFNGWKCTAPDSKGWVVENGTIFYNVQGPGYMVTRERFGNFELKADFMVDRGTNSGLFFRWANLADPVHTGIEMQILDSAGNKTPGKHDCGAIYDVLAPSENAMKPAMQWNTVILRCRDNFISVTMNGKQIIMMDLDRYKEPHKNLDGTQNKFNTAYKDMAREGHIGLQDHGGKVWFKNIKIRPLK